MPSFAEIAAAMDPVAPIRSLRELAGRHRWESPEPPSRISLALPAAWHFDPTARHRVLWLNTYLIHGFQVNLCSVTILARLAEKAQMEARSIVLELDLDPLDLVDRMHISDKALV